MELIAHGRTADVFDLGAERVLRRYRDEQSVQAEVRIMRHLEEHGYPVPHVFEAGGTDIVMERVRGVTLLEQLVTEPEQLDRYGRLLGELQERLHRMPAPAWLAGPGVPGDAVIVHRDLHPNNVLLTERGPLVIDWSDASAGRAAVDAAMTVIVILGAELDAGDPIARQVGPMRSLLIDSFLQTCGVDPREGLVEAIEFRRRHSINTDAEERWLRTKAPGCLDPFHLEHRGA